MKYYGEIRKSSHPLEITSRSDRRIDKRHLSRETSTSTRTTDPSSDSGSDYDCNVTSSEDPCFLEHTAEASSQELNGRGLDRENFGFTTGFTTSMFGIGRVPTSAHEELDLIPDVPGMCYAAVVWKLKEGLNLHECGDQLTNWQRRHFYVVKIDDELSLNYVSEAAHGQLSNACLIQKLPSSNVATRNALPMRTMEPLTTEDASQIVHDMRMYDVPFENKHLTEDAYRNQIPTKLSVSNHWPWFRVSLV